MVIVMTHGSKDGALMANDAAYHESKLLEHFIHGRCPSLHGKPKLLIIQACRGDEIDMGIPETFEYDPMTNSFEYINSTTLPTSADTLIMHSTQQGHTSYRDVIKGTWFIQALCVELRRLLQESEPKDLIEILTNVINKVSSLSNEVETLKQCPTYQSSLRKKFILMRKC